MAAPSSAAVPRLPARLPSSPPSPFPSPDPDHFPPDLSVLDQDASPPIALVGMAFRGPGDATSARGLWTMIAEGREAWSQIPKSRWNNSAFFHPDHARHGTIQINVDGGHFLAEDVARFDAPFFNMTSDEAAAMDPQQRLLLEVTYEGLENAGIPLSEVMGSQTACFVGCFNADYTDLLLRDPDCIPMYQCTNAGQSRAMTANRVSYFFDLKGPSVTVDTACSGSLVALHLACQSLQTGDASMAIAAGVNIILSHEFMSTMTMMKFLSPDGRCHTFDEKANGYARGEAIGCVVLKPLRDAIRDGDHIHAVIRGTGSNQDGRTAGITLPSSAAQETLIRHVYQRAGLEPIETGFVETHGTGTQAGDPIETEALARVFSPGRTAEHPLRVGSIKTNVGHLEGTSGVAGVIKAALMLENRIFLPNRNFSKLNPRILLDEWKLKVQLECEPWDAVGPHRVSVNSFGYGGSNAHAILEDAWGYMSDRGLGELLMPLPSSSGGVNSAIAHRLRVFMLSAFDEDSLSTHLSKLRTYLIEKSPTPDTEFMNNLAYTLNEHRTAHLYRVGVLSGSSADLAEALARAKVSKAPRRPTVGFVFTGQGAQWCGMGKGLMAAYPVFRRSIQRIDAYMNRICAPFRIAEILEHQEHTQLSHPLFSQSACTALQIALVDLLASWEIHPDSVTGHSSGEIAAAYTAGALNMEDAMAVAYYRGVSASNLSFKNKHTKGDMLAVGVSADDIQPYLDQLKSGRAVVACINSPRSVTISGDVSAIQELEDLVRNKEFSRRLAVGVAYHSHHMELVSDEYMKSILHIKPHSEVEIAHVLKNRSVGFFSSVSGSEVKPTGLGPQYWCQNLLGQVRFAQSLRNLCFETTGNRSNSSSLNKRRPRRAGTARKVSVDCLIEIGPHAALSGPIKQILKDDTKLNAAEIKYSSASIREKKAIVTILSVAASLASSGFPVNFRAINDPEPFKAPCLIADLPSYPWNHSRSYWAEPRISKVFRDRRYPRADILGTQDRLSSPFEPRWRGFIRVSEIPWLRDHRIQSNIVFPAAGYISMAIEAASQLLGDAGDNITRFYLRDIQIRSALVVQETSDVEVMSSLRLQHDSVLRDPFYEFHVYSVTDDDRWTEHCQGFVGLDLGGLPHNTVERALSPDHSGMSVLDIKAFYEKLANIGLGYGPCFTNITQARYTDETCAAEITIPDTSAVMPMNFQYTYPIHPCTLDSIMHSCFVSTNLERGPAIPVRIEEVSFPVGITSTARNKLDVHTQITRETKSEIVASITIMDKGRTATASIKGLHCRRLDQDSADLEAQKQKIAYKLEWGVDPDLLSVDALSTLLVPDIGNDNKEMASLYASCALFYFRKAMNDLDNSELDGIPPSKRQYLDELTHGEPLLQSAASELYIEAARSSGSEGKILCDMGDRLTTILRGQFHGPTVSTDRYLGSTYRDTAVRDPTFESVSRYLGLLGHKHPMMSILEVDAYAGKASYNFLQRLTGSDGIPRCGKYTLAHPDETAVEAASDRLAAWDRWVKFTKLDIMEDQENKADSHAYDVVIVPYGLHRVGSIQTALRNIHSLLKADGRLILINSLQNPTDVLLFADCEEAWLDNRTTCSNSEWDMALKAGNFSGVKAVVNSGRRSMIISRPIRSFISSSPDVLLIAEGACSGICSHLQDILVSVPLAVETADIRHANPTGKLCVVVSDLHTSLLAHTHKETFERIKSLLLEAYGVLWVTKGGTLSSTSPDASLITGFARTARSESAVQRIVTLDLDAERPLNENDASRLIYNVIENRFLVDGGTIDDEYAEQNGLLHIPRVIEDTVLNRTLAMSHDQYILKDSPFYSHTASLRAVYDKATRPRKVYFVEDDLPELPGDHVRIKVHAVGVDQHDAEAVFSTANMGHMLGSGCSGTVEAVGKDVHGLVPGDRVAGRGKGAAASKYQDQKTAFHKIAANMSFESAALSAVYCTAFHAVHRLAHVNLSDKVLISLGTGVLGQAIAEICALNCSHVFLITETEAERSLLSELYDIPGDRMLLRQEPSFAKNVLELGGRVTFDVIINCNESQSHTRELWNHIGQTGRFVQFSGTQKIKSSQWVLPRSRDDLVFATLGLHSAEKSSDYIDQIWKEVGELLSNSRLRGPVRIETHSVSKINEALDFLASGQVDSIVLTAGSEDVVKYPSMLLRPNVSYMLVGGLGGVGRATALWMADHGARTLIFVSRRGFSHPQSRATVRELEENGVNVVVHPVDISDYVQVEKMAFELLHTAPPICGVIQAAMVLRDIHIEKMTIEDYSAVLQPKHAGTWNLHHHLPKDLDWFIMLSSISGIIGNATQAAYAAGSTFMDSFAAYRTSLGLPTISLDLGVITEAGYLAENTDLASKMAKQGFQGTDTASLMSLIEAAITSTANPQPPGPQKNPQIITGLGPWSPIHSLPNFDAPLFAQYRRLFIDSTGETTTTDQSSSSTTLRENLQSAKSLENASAILYAALSTRVAAHLAIPVERIDPGNPITEYGIDSHVAVDLRTWILKNVDSSVSVLEILSRFYYPIIANLLSMPSSPGIPQQSNSEHDQGPSYPRYPTGPDTLYLLIKSKAGRKAIHTQSNPTLIDPTLPSRHHHIIYINQSWYFALPAHS
ncbi:polyketide synthase [Aspergillus ellipticus CBS 707.79]|uniref:Polyketide synthase n=1 Tax=Aspergillus ellipticus CBS 707.79 TaxID=1448320 RepID=A0A319DJ76_9EURO|nr:polyketide synthase [Aspergillus ellipticus CBS 707.79]